MNEPLLSTATYTDYSLVKAFLDKSMHTAQHFTGAVKVSNTAEGYHLQLPSHYTTLPPVSGWPACPLDFPSTSHSRSARLATEIYKSTVVHWKIRPQQNHSDRNTSPAQLKFMKLRKNSATMSDQANDCTNDIIRTRGLE